MAATVWWLGTLGLCPLLKLLQQFMPLFSLIGEGVTVGGEVSMMPLHVGLPPFRVPESFIPAVWASKGNTQVFPPNMRINARRALGIE